jgi:hypothetical protein
MSPTTRSRNSAATIAPAAVLATRAGLQTRGSLDTRADRALAPQALDLLVERGIAGSQRSQCHKIAERGQPLAALHRLGRFRFEGVACSDSVSVSHKKKPRWLGGA